MLPESRVPYDDVIGGVGQADQAVTGTQKLDLIAVAHKRVVNLLKNGSGGTEGVQINSSQRGKMAEEKGLIGAAEGGVGEVASDEAWVVDEVAPAFGDGAAAEEVDDRKA